MKKIIVTMLALTMSILMLAGCTQNDENSENNKTTTGATTKKNVNDKVSSALDDVSKAIDNAVTTTTKAG